MTRMKKCARPAIGGTLAATAAAVLVAAVPASANPALAAMSGPPAGAEDMGRVLYHLDRAVQARKAVIPRETARAALEAGDVAAALEISRRLPTKRCRIGWIVDGVVQTDCARIEILYKVASHPAARHHHVDWLDEIQRLDVYKDTERALLTAIAVKQAEGGDVEGAIRTANLHGAGGDANDALESIPALAAIAVAVAENGSFRRSLDLVREAHRRCNAAKWCGQSPEGGWRESGYQYDLQWALARIAMHRAEYRDIAGALFAVRLSDELVGPSSDWRDRAHRAIALEQARKGQLLAAAKSVASIEKDEWRVRVEREVKEVFAGQS